MIGNTIPTIFTEIIGKNLKKYIFNDIIDENDDKEDDDNNILTKVIKDKKINKGEINVKKFIFNFNKDKDYNSLIKIFGDSASIGIELLDKNNNIILTEDNISKADNYCKEDLRIKMIKTKEIFNISIKCIDGKPPAIINHTHRNAKIFQVDGKLHTYLSSLDEIIKIYFNKNKEDVKINELELNKAHKKTLINVLNFFVFEGTGCGDSMYPVNSILEIGEPNNIYTWNFIICKNNKEKINYIKAIYSRLLLSIRCHKPPKMCEQMKPWTNKDKFQLHIRINNSIKDILIKKNSMTKEIVV